MYIVSVSVYYVSVYYVSVHVLDASELLRQNCAKINNYTAANLHTL